MRVTLTVTSRRDAYEIPVETLEEKTTLCEKLVQMGGKYKNDLT